MKNEVRTQTFFLSSSCLAARGESSSRPRWSSEDRLQVVSMLCADPFVKEGKAFGCGQCLPCRINRRRIWTHRIMLESLIHSNSIFVTLTYDDASLPVLASGHGTLRPRDLQLFFKRLRKKIQPAQVRYFACGEYGEASWRPHYHVALFGFGPCHRGRTLRVAGKNESAWRRCCDTCFAIGEAWGLGLVEVGELTSQSAQYVAGYVVKKMTDAKDGRLDGRYPEFARMSNRPGLGYGAIPEVAATLRYYGLEERGGDVPGALRHGASVWPLGRYLTGRLRLECGYEDAGATPETLQKLDAELSLVREDAFANSISLKQAIVEANAGKREALLARYKIFNSRRSI